MTTDDGSFFPDGDNFDRFIDIISLVSRRVSLAILSAGFAVAGANIMTATNAESPFGHIGLGLSVVLGVWAVAANRKL